MIIAAENKVLLLNENQEEVSAGGIVLTGGKLSDTLKLKVVDVGIREDTDVAGKYAVVGRHNGYQFVHEGVDYKVCTLNDVLAWCDDSL